MNPELSIIKLFLNYSNWDKYSGYLTSSDFPEELKSLYRVLDVFHKEQNESKSDIQLLDLANLFFSSKPKDTEYYKGVFDNLDKYTPNETTVVELIKSLRKGNLLRKLSIESYNAAEGKKTTEDVTSLLKELEGLNSLTNSTDDEITFVSENLEELVNATIAKPGLRWRLDSLNRNLGSLRKGDFGFIFARPETGKTTFLASEASYMAEQLTEESGPIIWFNNEEQGDKVKLRTYQSSLGLSTTQLFANKIANNNIYAEKTKGKIKILDSASISKQMVEAVCRKYKPSLIIFDQIDKIKGFDSDREDLRLGAIYIWARELAKEYCPVIAVCQADGSGEGQRWLTMANVSNAKTSKQAEADWILGIGRSNDSGWEHIRFLHLSKNKLMGDDDSDVSMRHGKWETLIVPEIARYKDL